MGTLFFMDLVFNRDYVLKLLKITLITAVINSGPDEDYRTMVQSNLNAAAL